MTGSVGARWRATGSPEEAGAGVRVRHQAAEIPVTPSRRSSTSRAGSSLVPTYGSTGLGGSTSMTARGIAKLMSTKSIWSAIAPSSASIGSGTASPQNTCGETAPQSSPMPTACSDELESASAGCVAGPARPLAPRMDRSRPRLPQLAASPRRNRSGATGRRRLKLGDT